MRQSTSCRWDECLCLCFCFIGRTAMHPTTTFDRGLTLEGVLMACQLPHLRYHNILVISHSRSAVKSQQCRKMSQQRRNMHCCSMPPLLLPPVSTDICTCPCGAVPWCGSQGV